MSDLLSECVHGLMFKIAGYCQLSNWAAAFCEAVVWKKKSKQHLDVKWDHIQQWQEKTLLFETKNIHTRTQYKRKTVFCRILSTGFRLQSSFSWIGHLNCRYKNKLSRIIVMASKIVGAPQTSLNPLLIDRTRRKARSIVGDSSRPLLASSSLWAPLATRNIFKKSFILGARWLSR